MTIGQSQPGRRRIGRDLFIQAALIVGTLVAIELILVKIDLRYLRLVRPEIVEQRFRHDPELGWFPIPGSIADPRLAVADRHNSLGLRDVEPDATKPTILFIGDSMVWGLTSEATERFTDRLRGRFPNHQILNAGVSGYGTDQQYLLLKRLWDKIKPVVVVLTFCSWNDRNDNKTDRHDVYHKPYLQEISSGVFEFRGQPVPRARHEVVGQTWVGRNLMLARVAISAYLEIRHPRVSIADPTERLVGMMRDFVHDNGARFLVGVEDSDPALEAYLREQTIPFATLRGGDIDHGRDLYNVTMHWTAAGHAMVARKYAALLAENGIVPGAGATSTSGADR